MIESPWYFDKTWGESIDSAIEQQNRARDEKMQTVIKHAQEIISTNEECFMAQWVLQNQDKKIDDYTMCYQYCGDVIKFWMEEKK
jgi:hypothetical protein